MSSIEGKPYLNHLLKNSNASIGIEIKNVQSDIHRPHRHLKAVGTVILFTGENGELTRQISRKCLSDQGAEDEIERRSSVPRVVVKLNPERIRDFGGGKSI